MTYLNDFDGATYEELFNDVIKVCMTYDYEEVYLVSPKNKNVKTTIDNTQDIDIAIIIGDSTSKYNFCKDTSHAIYDLIIMYDVYISITPIFKSSFTSLDTMFIKNVSLGRSLILDEENEKN